MLRMPKKLVINTGPIIALIAALDDLDILKRNYDEVIVPQRVVQEILAKGSEQIDAKIFLNDKFLTKVQTKVAINTFLENSLDLGEASVIQTALNEGIDTVCIDEAAGRRIARLNSLKLTGSLGIIISAINEGENLDLEKSIEKMRNNGIWISDKLKERALNLIK
jgi:predicted nucleic acid-binding protein